MGESSKLQFQKFVRHKQSNNLKHGRLSLTAFIILRTANLFTFKTH